MIIIEQINYKEKEIVTKESCLHVVLTIVGSLSRYDDDDFMSKTMALHVRYKCWYMCLPSSTKQQPEVTKLKVL